MYWSNSTKNELPMDLIGEEPLSIRVQGKPYSVIMRTPGEEIAHVAGFCLGEGIIDTYDDIVSIAFCDGQDSNVVTVTLKEDRKHQIADHLDRRNYISQTSCGLCGKEMISELYQLIKPINDGVLLDIGQIRKCADSLSDHQTLRHQTRASHAAAIYDKNYSLISIAEDVGRHNALDKAIGKLLIKRRLSEGAFIVLSSRISYELVQKAARARIPVIFAISRPTALAVALASELNMTLACMSKDSGIYIFCGKNRLII